MLDIIETMINTAFSTGRITDIESYQEELTKAIRTVSLLGYGEITEEEVLSRLDKQFMDSFQLQSGIAIIQSDNSYDGEVFMDGARWRAYYKYLKNEKERSDTQLNSMSFTLQSILKHILKNDNEPYYVNGLIFKDVQSGKTEHFHGLSNLAIDNGYEYIIILAGTQNDLRSQTQIRCDYDILGEKRNHYFQEGEENPQKIVGIGQHRNEAVVTSCVTNKLRTGDLNARTGENSLVARPGEPVVIVTKKNTGTLQALINLLKNSNADRNKVLIIDDESDLASVDTAFKTKKNQNLLQNDKQYEPSAINKLIREMLEFLKKKAYISYTATPFANLLINRNIDHPKYGLDLYPKDFIIAIPSEKSYVGPKQWFGKNAIARPLRNLLENNIPEIFIREAENGVLHSTLKEALKIFVLSTAVRLIREGEKEHSSMLVHTDFRNISHDHLYPLVRAEMKFLSDMIEKSDEEILGELKKLFIEDISYKSKIVTGKDLNIEWQEVVDVLYITAKRIEVLKINGQSEDTLNYEEYKNKGLYVIAVGGNKLSRGITLDGLTISYYLRESSNHDTLTQMGRWSGYKKDYLDICRLYTTKRLAVAYAEIVASIEKLREDLIIMHDSDLNPDEYQLEIIQNTDSICPTIRSIKEAQDNLKLQLTANNKKRFSRKINRRTSLAGTTLQETSFFNDIEIVLKNKKEAEKLLISLEQEPSFTGKFVDTKGSNRIWYGEDMNKVLNFLRDFDSPRDRSNEVADYIVAVQSLTERKELSKCDIVLISNEFSSSNEKLANLPISRVSRSTRGVDTMLQSVTLKDEQFINLNLAENSGISDDQKIQLRKTDRSVLIIYPITTSNLEGTERYDIITFAIGFPFSTVVPKETTTIVIPTVKVN